MGSRLVVLPQRLRCEPSAEKDALFVAFHHERKGVNKRTETEGQTEEEGRTEGDSTRGGEGWLEADSLVSPGVMSRVKMQQDSDYTINLLKFEIGLPG